MIVVQEWQHTLDIVCQILRARQSERYVGHGFVGSGRHSWIHGVCCLLQAAGRDAGKHYFARSSFRLGQVLSFWGGWGGVEGWSRLGQGYDRVFSHLSKPRNKIIVETFGQLKALYKHLLGE